MPKLPGISYKRAVRALERAQFRVARRGKHVTMTDGSRVVTVPRTDPINGYTMAMIVRQAGLSIEQFKELL